MLVYIVIVIAYAVVLVPVAVSLVRVLRELARNPNRNEIYEGIAASCLVSVLAALLLTSGIGVRGGILTWSTYVAVTGIAIWLPQPVRGRDALCCAIAPALVLLGTLLAVYLLPVWLGQAAGAIVSSDRSVSGSGPSSLQAFTLTLFVSVISIPGTMVGIYARSGVVRFVKKLFALEPEKFGNVEKIFNTCIRIGALVLTIFAVAQV